MFITLEGIEGSGKTTQVENIVAFLKDKGHDCVVTREPGGTDIGKKIRAILLDPENRGLDPMAELLLYMADRAQHIREKILPSLSQGRMVVCDRFFDATTVYQGFARGLDVKRITRMHDLVFDGLKPDVTLLFDLPAKVGLSRAWNEINSGSRDGSETRFEKEDIAFHDIVRNGYLELTDLEPERFRVIDASKSIEEVREEITKTLSEELEKIK